MNHFAFYERLNEECGVRFPFPNEQDWEWCAGDYQQTNQYIAFYQSYSSVMNDWDKYLLINMIVQGIEDWMEYSEDTSSMNALWRKAKELLIRDEHRQTIVSWSCVGQELDDCWLITPRMRELL